MGEIFANSAQGLLIGGGVLLLCLILWGYSRAKRRKADRASALKAMPAAPVPEDLDEETFAVIAAAIAAMSAEGTTLVVRQIRRVGVTAPAWSAAGRADAVHSRG